MQQTNTTTAQQMRAWTGPAILTYGFRPFFFGAAVWAVLAMIVWVPMLSGTFMLPTAFDPESWNAHALLYGYLGAVIAGFLLTAIPNWTGRLPIVGWRLGGAGGSLAGRSCGGDLFEAVPAIIVASVDLAFPVLLAIVIGREIVAAKNWRNMIVLGMLGVFAAGNAVFHWEAAQGAYAAQGVGFRLGVGAAIMMIAVIGGRVVPSFTRNWLVKRRSGMLPAPPMQVFDKVSLLALLAALGLWVVAPLHVLTGGMLLIAGGLHLVRLARWAGHRTLCGIVTFSARLADHGGRARALHWLVGPVNLAFVCAAGRYVAGVSDPCAQHCKAEPFSFGGSRDAEFDAMEPGIMRLMRHPLLIALALWAGAHILPNGDLAQLILFGTFAICAGFGGWMIYRRKKRELGADWQNMRTAVAGAPSRKLSIDVALRLSFGGVIYVGLNWLHPWVLGVSPLP